mgnify:CR=1 FL=1
MHVDRLEKSWIWIVALIIVVMLASILYSAFAISVHPPSNVETIDSTRLHLTDEFAEDNLGVFTNPDGSVLVRMVATRYGFYPPDVKVPAGTAVTFRFATPDVLHGLHIPEYAQGTWTNHAPRRVRKLLLKLTARAGILRAVWRNVRINRFFKGRGLGKVWHALAVPLQLLVGCKSRGVRARHTTIQEALRIVILPLEDDLGETVELAVHRFLQRIGRRRIARLRASEEPDGGEGIGGHRDDSPGAGSVRPASSGSSIAESGSVGGGSMVSTGSGLGSGCGIGAGGSITGGGAGGGAGAGCRSARSDR